jgi:predicted nucleotidyltransferase
LIPRDRDFIKTIDNHLFCVVGYLHPLDRITAYLKYFPSSKGKWKNTETYYSRAIDYYHVSQIEKTYNYIKDNFPDYLYRCPIRNITVSSVPLNKIKKYYQPIERMRHIKNKKNRDLLENKVYDLVNLLSSSDTKTEIGVTGSILTKTHNLNFSDIDLTIYGMKTNQIIQKNLRNLKSEGSILRGTSPVEQEKWINQRVKKLPLSKKELKRIAKQRWNYGYYKGTYFSLHPIRIENEITEIYGENSYYQIDVVEGTAKITENKESIFLPAVYDVSNVDIDGINDKVSKIVSYEGVYGNLFEKNEKVKFKGILEQVKGKNPHLRVIIGGSGLNDGYITWC